MKKLYDKLSFVLTHEENDKREFCLIIGNELVIEIVAYGVRGVPDDLYMLGVLKQIQLGVNPDYPSAKIGSLGYRARKLLEEK